MSFKISTIIPVYNSEQYLYDAIESVISQKIFKNVQLILIDDGSTDNSASICKSFTQKYSNIEYHHLNNSGVSNARNVGLGLAVGDYIHFMDSDDTLLPNAYSSLITAGYNNKHDVIVSSIERINCIKHTTIETGPSKLMDTRHLGSFLENISDQDERWFLDYVWNKLYKRDFLLEHKILFMTNISLGEDFEFNCRTFEAKPFILFAPIITYRYSIRSTGLMTGFHANPWVGREILYQAHLKLYSSWGVLDLRRRNAINRYEGMLAFVALRSIDKLHIHPSKFEKIQHIEGMMNSSQWGIMLQYLRKSGWSKYFLYLLLHSKCSLAISFVLRLDRIKKIVQNKL